MVFKSCNLVVHFGLVRLFQLVAALVYELLRLVAEVLCVVLRLNLFTALLILLRKLLCLLDSLIDVFLAHVGGRRNRDVLFLAGAQILCRNIYDAVCVDIKGNFDLGDAARSRSDAVQLEQAQLLVVACKFTFALQNVDLNLRLAVSRRGEDLALLGRDGGVSAR